MTPLEHPSLFCTFKRVVSETFGELKDRHSGIVVINDSLEGVSRFMQACWTIDVKQVDILLV